MNNATLINQTSGKTAYFTPKAITVRASFAMGGIDLDPASCPAANLIIGAKWFWTKDDNGLSKSWHGKVWMNHPFSREGNAKWINKLVEEYECGNIEQACCITFACTSEKWYQPLLKQPLCFLYPRTNYLDEHGQKVVGVTKGSTVAYFGRNVNEFVYYFSQLGVVKL